MAGLDGRVGMPGGMLSLVYLGRTGIASNGRMWLRLVLRGEIEMTLSGGWRGSSCFVVEDVALTGNVNVDRCVEVLQFRGAACCSRELWARGRVRGQNSLVHNYDDGGSSMAVAGDRAEA